MIRFAKIIGDIYNLGAPRKTMTQAQNDIINFLGDDAMSYKSVHWNIPVAYNTRTCQDLIDHVDAFTNDITLIPYASNINTDDVSTMLKSDIRMELCMKHGLKYKVIKPDDRIFKDPKFSKCTVLIILHSDNWTDLRKNIIKELNAEYKAEWKRKFDEEN